MGGEQRKVFSPANFARKLTDYLSPSPQAILVSSHPIVSYLIVVAEVADTNVFIHVGMVKILPKPANITPVKIPLPLAGERQIQPGRKVPSSASLPSVTVRTASPSPSVCTHSRKTSMHIGLDVLVWPF